MTDEPIAADEGAPSKEFSIVRKGYKPEEVDEYLGEVDVAFREFEEYATRLKHQLAEAKVEITKLKASEQAAIDGAMLAVFDAKERILQRARRKAQEIVDQARSGAEAATEAGESSEEFGIPGVDDEIAESTGRDVEEQGPEAPPAPDQVVDSPAVPAPVDEPDANEVLRAVLEEAYTLRSQLETGMAAAVEEIDRLQRDAENRASALLDEARGEARQLRSAGQEAKAGTASVRDATTAPGASSPRGGSLDKTKSDRPSRYARNSAKLPRIGSDPGGSVLASMNRLRNTLREEDEAGRQVQDPPAS